MDPDPDPDETDPPAAPTVFGLPAHPLGCGVLGALLFAALIGPALLLAFEAGAPGFSGRALLLVAATAAAFGLAAASLVRRWPFRRPPLWAALVGLTLMWMTLLGPALLWVLSALVPAG